MDLLKEVGVHGSFPKALDIFSEYGAVEDRAGE
jgi:hypothetical protein